MEVKPLSTLPTHSNCQGQTHTLYLHTPSLKRRKAVREPYLAGVEVEQNNITAGCGQTRRLQLGQVLQAHHRPAAVPGEEPLAGQRGLADHLKNRNREKSPSGRVRLLLRVISGSPGRFLDDTPRWSAGKQPAGSQRRPAGPNTAGSREPAAPSSGNSSQASGFAFDLR